MGRVVDYTKTSSGPDGVGRLAITQGDMKQVAAEFVRIEKGGSVQSASPGDCDGYWFTLRGAGRIDASETTAPIKSRSFIAVESGEAVKLSNDGSDPLELIHILAPAPGGPVLPGFTGGVSVTNFEDIQSVFEEDSQKRRFFYVGKKGGYDTDRAQGMVVQYAKATKTPKHYHPDAESVFILLDGAVEFTVNGQQQIVEPGNVVYFGMNDVHSSSVADGRDKAEFFEFHLPGAFSIVRI